MKSGTYVYLYGLRHPYMFLGWSDYNRKYGVVADLWGNKHIHKFK